MRSPADNPQRSDVTRPGLLHPLVAIVVCFGAVFVLSQFFRASNAVIAKTLSAEFGLSPEALGLLTGMFFLSFGAAQIPVGMLFDRFGARRTAPVVLTAAIAGSILYGLADGEAMLIAGRLLLGIGCSVVLMGSLFLFGQWAPAASFSTWMGRMIAIGGAGGLLSTTPLAAIAETLGWRTAFWGRGGADRRGCHRHLRDGPRPPIDRNWRRRADGGDTRKPARGPRGTGDAGVPHAHPDGICVLSGGHHRPRPLGRALSRGPARARAGGGRQRAPRDGGHADRGEPRARPAGAAAGFAQVAHSRPCRRRRRGSGTARRAAGPAPPGR